MKADKQFILKEIRRLADTTGGVPPGQEVFKRATGLTPAMWRGVHWLKWSEALAEAGYAPNDWNQPKDAGAILREVAPLVRRLCRLPTAAEMKMERRSNSSFPAHSTVQNHYRSMAALNAALLGLAEADAEWSDLGTFLKPMPEKSAETIEPGKEGLVYLLLSGRHYKIGRSDDIERRFREVSVALPDKVVLVHTIRTDDPPGIEAYWHRRFATARANGEWFALSASDVKAFCRRTFQ